jgi:hypothetical protein
MLALLPLTARVLFATVVSCGLLLAATPVKSDAALDAQRLENARRMMLVNRDDYEEVLNLWTDDVNYKDSYIDISGKEAMRTFLIGLWNFMPEYNMELNEEVYQQDGSTEEGIYMVYWKMTGTSRAPNLPPNWPFGGEPTVFEADGLSMLKFRPGESQCYFHIDMFTEGDMWVNLPGYGRIVKFLRNYYERQVT